MRKADPTFSERNYGAASFTRFLANYDHLLTVGDGGIVEVVTEGLERAIAREQRGNARSEDKREREARAVLLRTVLEAAQRHGNAPIPLSRLKDTMQAVAPDFDELALGYKSFTRFLSHYPDILVVDRAANTARPNDGILALPGDRAADASATGPDRRRRAKKGRDGAAEPPREKEPTDFPLPPRVPPLDGLDVAPALADKASIAAAGPATADPQRVETPLEEEPRPPREPREGRVKTIPRAAGLPGLDP
jgi:hypothetical protein